MRHCERDESGKHGGANRVTLYGGNVNTDERKMTLLRRTVIPVLLESTNKAHILSTCGSLVKSLADSGVSSENDSSERKRPGPAKT